MVNGRVATPLAVVDLDGTLLKGNSLRRFIPFLLRHLQSQRQFLATFKLLTLMALRSVRIISHRRMKHPIHRHAERMTREDMAQFISLLLGDIDMQLLDSLRASGSRLLLATAAPYPYSRPLAEVLGFDGCIATHYTPRLSDYEECRGERKAKMALDFARHNQLEATMVVTDHSDDLPLLRLDNIKRLLVNPSEKLTTALKTENLPFDTYRR